MILVGLMLDLDRDEWFVAILFGVALDLDHVFAAPKFIGAHGWGALMRPSWDDGTGLVWRSLLHEPVGAFVVIPLAVGWRLMLPLLFWAMHVGIDYLQNETLAYSTPLETVVFTGAVLGIVAVVFRRWSRLQTEDAGFKRFLQYAGARVRAYVSLV